MPPVPPLTPPPTPPTPVKSARKRDYRSLVTPDLISRAQNTFQSTQVKKYVEVLNPSYTVKLGPNVSHYEYRVLQFLEDLPEIPTPSPIAFFDTYVLGEDDEDPAIAVMETWHVMIITTIPGRNLGLVLERLTMSEIVDILEQSMRYIDRINVAIDKGAMFPDSKGIWSPLERPVDSIGNLDGDQGHYIEVPFYGNFGRGSVRIDDFVSTMSKPIAVLPEHVELLASTLSFIGPSDANDIRFCHMDLHPGNIMVHNGQVSGIIDWELAGWYTWELEVMGGTKELFDPRDLAPYVEAWDVADDLETVITKSMPTLSSSVAQVSNRDTLARMQREMQALGISFNHDYDDYDDDDEDDW